jgi:hypothetical protein
MKQINTIVVLRKAKRRNPLTAKSPSYERGRNFKLNNFVKKAAQIRPVRALV